MIACEDVHRRCFTTTNVSQEEDQNHIDKFLHFSAPVRELRGIKSGWELSFTAQVVSFSRKQKGYELCKERRSMEG
ncbi:hypothetical protein EJP617_09590 [Erwinia sp. Ejp617]|nr:hypothetical protein EJP617_09590 [Erwinia sp. Ejp617]